MPMLEHYSVRVTPLTEAYANVQHASPTRAWITSIYVPAMYRRCGHGTTIMNKVCHDADKLGINFFLQVYPDIGISEVALIKWYETFGFCKYDDEIIPNVYTMLRLCSR